MTADQLKTWMTRNNLSKDEVHRITDIEPATLDRYLDGSRRIPKVVHLACIAFDEGLCPWGY